MPFAESCLYKCTSTVEHALTMIFSADVAGVNQRIAEGEREGEIDRY